MFFQLAIIYNNYDKPVHLIIDASETNIIDQLVAPFSLSPVYKLGESKFGDWQLICAAILVQLGSEYCDLSNLCKNIPQVTEFEAACLTCVRGHTCTAAAKMPVEIEV